jgi:hypothetical protein
MVSLTPMTSTLHDAGINLPQVRVSTCPGSWYQLAPSRIRCINGSNTIGFYPKSCGEWQIVQKNAMNNELCDDMGYTGNCAILCGERKIVQFCTDRTQMLPLLVEQSDEACNNGMMMKRDGLMNKEAEAGDRK